MAGDGNGDGTTGGAGRLRRILRRLRRADLLFLAIALLLPVFDPFLPEDWRIADLMRPIFVFAVLGLGLNVVTGFTGLLNLGMAAFMAIGAYAFSILTCEIYPYRLSFWTALPLTAAFGAAAGLVLGAPTLRLRGDYIAIVTLGFGEIVQDTLKNIEVVTKGTQGINPIPPPRLFGYEFAAENYAPWYYLYLAILALVVVVNRFLENSRMGRSWMAIREDELAASCMGIEPVKMKLTAMAFGAAFAATAGGLFVAGLGTSGEPSNYDFAVSISALCIVIVGGLGNVSGVLLGAFVMIGIDSIALNKLTVWVSRQEFAGSNVLLTPTNWKFMIFGLALVLMMRFRPEGLLPSRRVSAELHHEIPETAE